MNCTCTADNKNCFHIKKKMKLVDLLKNVVQMWHRFFLKVFLDSVVEKIIIPHDASFSYVYLYILQKKLCILLCCVALRSSCSEHEKIFENVTKDILFFFWPDSTKLECRKMSCLDKSLLRFFYTFSFLSYT